MMRVGEIPSATSELKLSGARRGRPCGQSELRVRVRDLSRGISGSTVRIPRGADEWQSNLLYPNKSMTGSPVVREREIPVASCGSLIGMSRAR